MPAIAVAQERGISLVDRAASLLIIPGVTTARPRRALRTPMRATCCAVIIVQVIGPDLG